MKTRGISCRSVAVWLLMLCSSLGAFAQSAPDLARRLDEYATAVAKRADFAKRFGENEYFVIEARGTALGALCLERRTDAIYILELQLLPQYQGSGIGTDVIQGVIRDATRENLAVALSVVPANHRAKRLYERLGFEVTGVEPPFIRMARAKPSV